MIRDPKAHKHKHFIGIPTLLGFIKRGFNGISLSLFLLMCLWGALYDFMV